MKYKDTNELIAKSNDIVTNLGYELIRDEYYGDICYGKEYKYDKLKITLYDDGILYVYIGDKEVLYHNSRENRYLSGRWTELIDVIHKQIPSILAKRELEAKLRKQKIAELESLREYFKYYIKSRKNEELLNSINNELYLFDITVEKGTRNFVTRNLCTGDDEYVPYGIFTIKHKNKAVAKFNDNDYDPISSPEENIKYFKQGNWTENFKAVLENSKFLAKELTQHSIDNTADDLIKKFTKTHKK